MMLKLMKRKRFEHKLTQKLIGKQVSYTVSTIRR